MICVEKSQLCYKEELDEFMKELDELDRDFLCFMDYGTRQVDGSTRRVESTRKVDFDQSIDFEFNFDQSRPLRGHEYGGITK